MDLSDRVRQHESHIIDLRRDFHRHPELANEEFRTANRICEELTDIGIPFERFPHSTAVVGCLKGKGAGSIALRADMDALPMDEKADVPYRSEHPGKAHTCGHDAHMAMLLGAARVLYELREQLNATVYFCFQPAEEIGEGVQELLDYLLPRKVEQIIALHVWSAYPTNTLTLLDGAAMAGGNAFRTTVRGKGGHGSRPDLVHDPIKAACELVLKWSTIPSNFYDVFSPCVIHTGMIHGGTVDNIFPDEVHMETGTRNFKLGGVDLIMEQIRRIADGVEVSHQVQVDLDVFQAQEPVMNNPACAAHGRKVASQMGLALSGETNPVSASDFCYLLQKIPGFYAFLGVANAEKKTDYPQHHSCYNIDEDVLKTGTEFFVRYVLDL